MNFRPYTVNLWKPCDLGHHRSTVRRAWVKTYGPYPKRTEDGRVVYVCHWCNNGDCTEPTHLYLATSSENLIYAARCNRLGQQRPEVQVKLSAAGRGRVLGPESIAKMRASLTGRKLTIEHRAKLSDALRRRHYTAEMRAKMSAVRKGKAFSPEHRANLSAAMKAVHRRKAEAKHAAPV